jgi:hypothetical protein
MWDCARNWSCWSLDGAAVRGASAYQGKAIEGRGAVPDAKTNALHFPLEIRLHI